MPVPTSDALYAISKMVGKECAQENLAFWECKDVDKDPEKCQEQAATVLACVNNQVAKAEKHCGESFAKWSYCLKTTYKNHFLPCRELQRTFEACWAAKTGPEAQVSEEASA